MAHENMSLREKLRHALNVLPFRIMNIPGKFICIIFGKDNK